MACHCTVSRCDISRCTAQQHLALHHNFRASPGCFTPSHCHSFRSAQVRAYDDRALCWDIVFSYRRSLRPVVKCPYLHTSDSSSGRSWVGTCPRSLWRSSALAPTAFRAHSTCPRRLDTHDLSTPLSLSLSLSLIIILILILIRILSLSLSLLYSVSSPAWPRCELQLLIISSAIAATTSWKWTEPRCLSLSLYIYIYICIYTYTYTYYIHTQGLSSASLWAKQQEVSSRGRVQFSQDAEQRWRDLSLCGS